MAACSGCSSFSQDQGNLYNIWTFLLLSQRYLESPHFFSFLNPVFLYQFSQMGVSDCFSSCTVDSFLHACSTCHTFPHCFIYLFAHRCVYFLMVKFISLFAKCILPFSTCSPYPQQTALDRQIDRLISNTKIKEWINKVVKCAERS